MNNLKFQKNPYLWAVGIDPGQFQPSELVKERYRVISNQIWQDTNPLALPFVPDPLPQTVIPYLKLFSYRLHLPEVYGICVLEDRQVILLENAPIDDQGNLYPNLEEVWTEASSVRQIYWLWQILELWTPLENLGVVSSLLVKNNLRVEGSFLRLQELIFDAETPSEAPNLVKLGLSWENLAKTAKSDISFSLTEMIMALQADALNLKDLKTRLNELLLQEASQQPLRIKVSGATDVGIQPKHNEDSYYPSDLDLSSNGTQSHQTLASHLMIVCDGIGGHEGGEVASQLAVQSIKLQIQALLAEIAQDNELMTPELVEDQLSAIIRVANNMIAARNDEQARESRRRMGTTLVMALQLPQQIGSEGNSHEVYLVSIGDSRAYWITNNGFYQLTVDDDVASREVRLGKSLYRQALQRSDATALTQALGTREGDSLKPNIQRLIIEEDGLLLLCSDGVSDNNLLEECWESFAPVVINGRIPLETAVESLIELANQKNGHDNISVVIASYQVSPQYPVLVNLEEIPVVSSGLVHLPLGSSELVLETPGSLTEDTEAPMILDAESEDVVKTEKWSKVLFIATGSILLLILAAVAGLFIQWLVYPNEFQQLRDRLFKTQPQQNQPLPPPDGLK